MAHVILSGRHTQAQIVCVIILQLQHMHMRSTVQTNISVVHPHCKCQIIAVIVAKGNMWVPTKLSNKRAPASSRN